LVLPHKEVPPVGSLWPIAVNATEPVFTSSAREDASIATLDKKIPAAHNSFLVMVVTSVCPLRYANERSVRAKGTEKMNPNVDFAVTYGTDR
jgi:hypothetical protein